MAEANERRFIYTLHSYDCTEEEGDERETSEEGRLRGMTLRTVDAARIDKRKVMVPPRQLTREMSRVIYAKSLP